MVVTSIRVPKEIYLAFKERAKRNDRSLNKEIVRLMRLELEKEQRELCLETKVDVGRPKSED